METGCYATSASNPNEIWKSGNVFSGPLPSLALQIGSVMLLTRITYYVLKPFHQPRLIADILTGSIIGPQFLMATTFWKGYYPLTGVLNVETITHMGLLYYVFLSGLEMNLEIILQASKKGTSIAVAGIIFPMLMGAGIFALHQSSYRLPLAPLFFDDNSPKAYLFWTISLSVTGFPVVARILADLKLFDTGLGRTALNAAMLSDFYNWVLFTISIPFAINHQKAIYSMLSTILFILICFFVVHPPLKLFINRKTDEDSWDYYQLTFVLVGAFVCGYITDLLGTHSIVGAFVFGLIIPPGKFSDMLIEKSDDFVSGALAPLFFIGAGLRINFMFLCNLQSLFWSVLLIVMLSIPKIFSTVIATTFFGMSIRDGVGLGLLMNTKGVLSMVLLILAWDRKILNRGSYTVIVTAIFLMTAVVAPLINFMYKPKKRFERYKLRTVEKLRKDVELRILACVHNNRHASSMVNLIEALNTTRISPLHIFVLQLVELTGRATAVLTAHMEKKYQSHSGELTSLQSLTKSQAELECVTNTFKGFSDANDAARVEILTAVSIYETIHEDIYTLAEERCTSLILLPFFKQPNIEGDLETINVAHRDINLNVMQDAACSVGLFVDRGFGSSTNTKLRVLLLFLGGTDDREALAVAWRMAGNRRVQLSMVRIILCDEAAQMGNSDRVDQENLLSTLVDSEKQKQLDDEYVNLFRHKVVHDEDSINYFEEEVHNADEITSLLRELDENGCDLYIVGRGKGRNSKLLSKLLETSDWPELGVLGDVLASSAFGSHSSVLVLQQYDSGGRGFSTKVQQPNRLHRHYNDFETLVVTTE
ncbi:hypothetical protein L6164_003684 [Bauhinia variegata]|uniref:Uncharacterized protein n=1 Tax=Bauhinia variegata TaxID=167791 RepID=A0ACB9Q170_BAUVA|nr:hypothetical protein L6164_003684 [Bauhinia variegata]